MPSGLQTGLPSQTGRGFVVVEFQNRTAEGPTPTGSQTGILRLVAGPAARPRGPGSEDVDGDGDDGLREVPPGLRRHLEVGLRRGHASPEGMPGGVPGQGGVHRKIKRGLNGGKNPVVQGKVQGSWVGWGRGRTSRDDDDDDDAKM